VQLGSFHGDERLDSLMHTGKMPYDNLIDTSQYRMNKATKKEIGRLKYDEMRGFHDS